MNDKVPFYPNQQDNAHCAPAVFKSLIEYFCGEKLSWEEMDRLGYSVEGKGTWTVPYHLKLAQCGVEVRIIEAFDYEAFAAEGKKYLESLGERGQFYINSSNWQNAFDSISDFLAAVHHESRNATIKEIDELLEQGYLVGAELNSRALNDKAGFVLHYVLVKKKQGDEYLINDPGGSTAAFENRLVSKDLFKQAIGGELAQYEVAAFRKI
ncbi:MAG: hypothetical protein AAB541_02685 [Patescibacteria group bacterium]